MSTTHVPTKASSPLLNVSEMQTFFIEQGVDLTLDEIKNPTPESISKTMTFFVDFFMDPVRTNLKTAPLQAVAHLQYPELFEQGVSEMETYQNILEFCWQIGVEQLSIKHLLYPDFANARVMWSAAINFALFRAEYLKVYQEFEARTTEIVEEKSALESEMNTLKPEIDKLKISFAKTAPIIKAREAESKELSDSISRLNKEQSVLKEETKAMKEEIQHLNEKMANDKFNFLHSQQQCDTLRNQIVKSPEKLKSRLVQMKADITQKSREVGEQTDRLSHMRAQAMLLKKVSGKLDKRIMTLRECAEQKKKGKELHQELKTKLKDYQKQEDEIITQRGSAQHHEQQISSSQAKLESLQRQAEQKRVKAQQALDEAERKRAALKFSIGQDLDQVKHNQGIIQRKEMDLQRQSEEHSREMEELQKHLEQLLKSVRTYHSETLSALA